MSELRDPPESDDFEWVNSWAGKTTPATDGKPKQEAPSKPESASRSTSQPGQSAALASAPIASIPVTSTPAASAPAPVVAETPPKEIAPERRPETAAPKPPAAQAANAPGVVRSTPNRKPDIGPYVHPAARRFFAALRVPTGRGEAPAPVVQPVPAPNVPATLTNAPAPTAATNPEPAAAPVPTDKREAPSIVTSVAPVTPAPVSAAPTAIQPANVESAEASLVPEAAQLERDIAEIESARDALLEPAPFTIRDPRKPRGPLAMLRNPESVPILVGSVVGATLLIVFGAAASLISLR